MKPITVKEQVRLSVGRCFGLAFSSMSYRFFRSMVTVSVLALAVAFLAHMLIYGMIEHRTKLSAYNELRDSRSHGEWVTRLTAPDPEGVILANIALALRPTQGDPEQGRGVGGTDRTAEYKVWSGATADEWAEAQAAAREVEAVYQYFQGLPPAAQAILTSGLEPSAALARLARPELFEAFQGHLAELRLEPPLGDIAVLKRLVQESQPRLAALVDRIQAGQLRAIGRVREAFGGQSATARTAVVPGSPRAILAAPPAELAKALADAGFHFDSRTLDGLARFARRDALLATLTRGLDQPAVKTAVVQKIGLERANINTARVLELVDSEARATWLAGVLSDQPQPIQVEATEVLALANDLRREARLAQAVGDEVPDQRQGLLAVPPWMQWLIALSFLVCMVGVANAMTMAVTERFTEIATMKCLGAMNGVVMTLFLIESSMQGLVGAIAGLILGIGLALGRGLAGYGGLMAVPGNDLLLGSGVCLAAGMVLAVVAAVGPAWMAARLAPMEAMRIE
jgi:hypothetical protein